MRRTSLLLASALFATPAAAMEGVVASIKPVHSLVAGVMQGVGEPALLVDGAGSPHTFSMRPSDAQALESAEIVFWIGPGMETFLAGPLETLADDATVVELAEVDGLVKLEYREGGAFEPNDPDDHDHHEGERAEAVAEDHRHDDHGHGAYDMHLWLDPENAKRMVGAIEDALATADPANAAIYAQNADALEERLDALTTEIEAELATVKDRPFVTFHDAYHYFEDRFGLRSAGTITVSPEVAPGAQRVAEIQARLGELGATCVFSEPQFEPRIVAVVTEGTDAKAGVLDPLGAGLKDGPELYFELLRTMTASLKECLSGGN